jgi:uncharacterized iron-regulated membrane protein
MFRTLVFIHRYVGIAVGLLMAMWCLSGVVMMYVPYPRLTDEQRVAGLQAIDWRECCHFGESVPAGPAAGPISDGTRVQSFQLEMLGGRPVLRAVLAGSGRRVIDLRTGSTIESVSEADAARAASLFAASRGVGEGVPHTAAMILRDQWTVALNRAEQPFRQFELDDPARTVVYVSGVSGKVVQVTQSAQRFWNWLGSVPHWLYPTALRQHPVAWNQAVIWTSVIGTFLTITGLYLGIKELRRRSNGKLSSPHRGLMYWHHVPGLVFGVLVLSWVVSGLFSMNPWGLMETERVGDDRELLSGEPPRWSEVRGLIESVAARAPADVRSLSVASFGGELAAVASLADGSRVRLDTTGVAKPLGKEAWDAAAAALVPAPARSSWSVLTAEDAYHYSTRTQSAALPVIRIMGEGTQSVRYYLDPISGRMVNKVDAGGRSFRWWHSALHTFDFSSLSRSEWFRNLLMLPLLLGAAAVCVTGTWLGVRRLTR